MYIQLTEIMAEDSIWFVTVLNGAIFPDISNHATLALNHIEIKPTKKVMLAIQREKVWLPKSIMKWVVSLEEVDRYWSSWRYI